MSFEYFWLKLFAVFKGGVIILLGFLVFQTLIRIIISAIIKSSNIPIDSFNCGLLLGKSIRRIHMKSKYFDLYIGRIGFNVSWIPSITLHDVELQLFPQQKDAKNNKNIITKREVDMHSDDGSSDNYEQIKPLAFTISPRILKIFIWLSSITTLIRRCKIILPNGIKLNLRLASLHLTYKSDKEISANLFLHELCNFETDERINHINFDVRLHIHKEIQTATHMTKFTLVNWRTSLKVGDISINVPQELYNFSTKNKQKMYGDNIEIAGQKNESLSDTENAMLVLRCFINRYEYNIRTLHVVDIKLENIVLNYQPKLSVNISSVQLFMETLDTFNNGILKTTLAPDIHALGQHEFSISINTIVFKVDNISTVRVPLTNFIVSSNIISHFIEDVPLNKATVSCTTNLINPSIFLTIDQLVNFIQLYDSMSNTKSKLPTVDIPTKPSAWNSFKDIIDNGIDLDIFPSFSFEFSLSNFACIFQLSRHDSLTFKIFDIEVLLGFSNRELTLHIKDLVPSKQIWPFVHSQPNEKKFSNFIKIVGTEVSYMNTSYEDSDKAMSYPLPICGFERVDTFIHEMKDKKIDVESTIRHLHCSLDDLRVVDTLSRVISRLNNVFPDRKSHISAKKNNNEPVNLLSSFEISLKLRFKDVVCSMVIANYLSPDLDSIEFKGINLASVQRGTRLICEEAQLWVDGQQRKITIKDVALLRFMDNKNFDTVNDKIVHFNNFTITFDELNNVCVTLPVVIVKFDVNILWLIFYMKSIISHYVPKKSSSKPTDPYGKTKSFMESINIRIDKIIIDVMLPHGIPMLFIFKMITYENKRNFLSINNFTILVKSVYVESTTVYVTFLEVDNITFDIQQLLTSKSISMRSASWHFHTEYHFKVYSITDNIITMYKAFKQLKLAFSNIDKFQRLYPKVQNPSRLPKIIIKSDKFLIDIEEDPFEQELGLIFKVGVLEQRERLNKIREFDEQIKAYKNRGNDVEYNSGLSDSGRSGIGEEADDLLFEENAYRKLMTQFSTSWIVRFRKARCIFKGMPYKISPKEDAGLKYSIFSKQQSSTVANLIVNCMDLIFRPPSFPVDNVNEFLYKYGKGIPKETCYTLLIIMGIHFKTELWELRLRDYPIPILSFPNTDTSGDVVFAEQMPDEHALHTIYVPFVLPATSEEYETHNSIYGTHIIRTMNSVKTFANCKTTVNSSSPACITWGKSLQPGFESLMLWFDYLTKPKLDPSEKLGFWDKFRYLFHGKWTYEFLKETGLHLNIKGAHNPYKIADEGAGLTFCWNGNTVLNIHGTTDPKELLRIESERFQLGIRDFTVTNKFDKVLTKFYGNVVWKMGMLFEEGDFLHPGDTERSMPTRPHHNVHLINPDFVDDKQIYDSYAGFRSSFINMSFGVYSSQKGSINNIFLAPQASSHFIRWWTLFNTYTSGPIRQGPLFTDLVQNKRKFGRSLYTIKYQLHLEQLTVAYVYQHLMAKHLKNNTSKTTFTGLKGRFNSLKIDLHQRKLKLTHSNAKLNKTKPVWKFRMSTGEIDCSEADVRIISTVFDNTTVEKILHQNTKSKSDSKLSPFDVDILRESEWYDFEDYLDLNQVSMKGSLPLKLEAIPLMYSPRISYFRRLNEDGIEVPYPFGDEESHNCIIGKNHPEKTQEKLALRRKHEINEAIKNVEFKIDNMTYSNHTMGKTEDGILSNLHGELHELHKRLHIINNILNDLNLSSPTAAKYSEYDFENGDISSDSSLDSTEISMSELSRQTTNSSLLRANTVESFVSMRRESTQQLDTTYDNRFIVHNIQLIIDKKIRDHLLQYAYNMLERKTMKYAMTYKAVKMFKDLLKSVLKVSKVNLASMENSDMDNDDGVSNTEFIEKFEELIKEVPDDNFDAVDSYLFRLISPQIQVKSELEPNSVVLLSARDIEVGIIDIIQVIDNVGKRMTMDIDTIVETRYCSVAKDIQMFTLFKDDVAEHQRGSFHRNGYGMDKLSEYWPPWIPLEMCFDGSLLEKHVFLRRRSMFLTFTAPNPLYFSSNDVIELSSDSKFRIGFPGLMLSSTSKQYYSFYTILQDVLTFKSDTSEKVERLTRKLITDEVRNNLDKLDLSVITNYQLKIKELFYTRAYLKVNNPKSYAESSQAIMGEIETSILQLTSLMKAIKQNYDRIGSFANGHKQLKWQVGTDELLWELFDKQNSPFITIGLGSSTYYRTESSEGTISNRVAISSLRCFNLQKNPIFIELLAPFDDHPRYNKSRPMVEISWVEKPPIGGISNIEELIVLLQPIVFKMDNQTGTKLLNYLFPKSETKDEDQTNDTNFPSNEDMQIYSPRVSFQSDRESVYDQISIEENKDIDSWDLQSFQVGKTVTSGSSKKNKSKTDLANEYLRRRGSYFNEMLFRAGLYFNIKLIVIRKSTMSVSYKGSHHVLTDVNNLTIKIPELSYRDKLWSREELFEALKRDIVKVVLHHLGSIIGNKFVPHKKENKLKIKLDMSQILDSAAKTVKSKPTSALESVSTYDSSISAVKTRTRSTKGSTSQEENNDTEPFFPDQVVRHN